MNKGYRISRDFLRKLLDFCNLCISPVDSLFQKTGNESGPQPLFIIGAPRSGTTLTYQTIVQYFDVAYFNNTYNYLYGIPNIVGRLCQPFINHPDSNFESNYGHIKGFFSPGEPANFWFRWFPRDGENGHYLSADGIEVNDFDKMKEIIYSLISLHKKPIVFKNVYHTMTVGVLAKVFPQARFIRVKRDILANIQSMLKGRQKISPDDWWSVKPPGYRSLQEKPVWEQVTTQIYIAEYYARKNLETYAQGRYLEINYSDLCNSPLSFLNTLEHWLYDIGFRKRHFANIPSSFEENKKLNLPPELIFKIELKLKQLETSK